jgi:AcrR family transcriptional regulator
MTGGRRERILEATLVVVAREGCHGLSFAKVVEEAGVSSTRLISYHFGSRDDLLREAFGLVLTKAGAFMGPRIAAESSMRGKVRAYVISNLQFLEENPVWARAAIELASCVPSDQGGLELLESGFRQGQESGELRDFDAHVMAVALRGAIDASVVDVVDHGAESARVGAELAELFDRAIRA